MVKKRTIITITEYDDEYDDTYGGVFVKLEQEKTAKPNVGASFFIHSNAIKASVLSKEDLIKRAIDQLKNDIQKGG